MRNNIGRGYFIEKMDQAQQKIIVAEPLVDLYFPEDIKKKSNLNREPKAGDIIETSNQKQVLLVQVFHKDNSESAQEELLHGNKIDGEYQDISTYSVSKDTATEQPIDQLITDFFNNQNN